MQAGAKMPKRPAPYRPPRVGRRDGHRPTAAARGYCTAAWQRLRLAVIARDEGVCQECGRICNGGKDAQIDHIEEKALNEPATAAGLSGLRLLCLRCHAKKSLRLSG